MIMIVMIIETTINGASNPLFHLFLMHFINKTINAAVAGISKRPVKIIIKLPSAVPSPDIISFIPPFYSFIAIKAIAASLEDGLEAGESIEKVPMKQRIIVIKAMVKIIPEIIAPTIFLVGHLLFAPFFMLLINTIKEIITAPSRSAPIMIMNGYNKYNRNTAPIILFLSLVVK